MTMLNTSEMIFCSKQAKEAKDQKHFKEVEKWRKSKL